MVKAGVYGPLVNIIAQAQLLNPPQALKVWVLNNIKYQLVRNGYKSVHRVVKYFAFVHYAREENPYWGKMEIKIGIT